MPRFSWKDHLVFKYPPFSNGLYLEEYFSSFYNKNRCIFDKKKWVLIDVFWTNIYGNKYILTGSTGKNMPELQEFISETYPSNKDIQYFTVVQFDDGIFQKLPENTIVFSAGGGGHVKLPLLYEDTTKELESYQKIPFEKKDIFCSFVGNLTHSVRKEIVSKFENNNKFVIRCANGLMPTDVFKNITSRSKFCLAPRGYGRSSFRFWEAYQLGSIPIYVYDDIDWLPYQEKINYDKFSIVIHIKDIDKLESILEKIDSEKYKEMWDEYNKISHFFSLNGMSEYILNYDVINTTFTDIVPVV